MCECVCTRANVCVCVCVVWFSTRFCVNLCVFVCVCVRARASARTRGTRTLNRSRTCVSQANPPKSKKAHAKREQMLLQRGRFWKEIRRNKVIEGLMEKYDKSKTGYLNKEVQPIRALRVRGPKPAKQTHVRTCEHVLQVPQCTCSCARIPRPVRFSVCVFQEVGNFLQEAAKGKMPTDEVCVCVCVCVRARAGARVYPHVHMLASPKCTLVPAQPRTLSHTNALSPACPHRKSHL